MSPPVLGAGRRDPRPFAQSGPDRGLTVGSERTGSGWVSDKEGSPEPLPRRSPLPRSRPRRRVGVTLETETRSGYKGQGETSSGRDDMAGQGGCCVG